jgi:hypothetical protein
LRNGEFPIVRPAPQGARQTTARLSESIPLFGAGFTIVVMVAFLASPGIGIAIDWLARHRQGNTAAR